MIFPSMGLSSPIKLKRIYKMLLENIINEALNGKAQKRIFKGYNTKSRNTAWSNALAQNGLPSISRGTHIYTGSKGSIDYFRCRSTQQETSVRNLTFNNGGL